MKPVRTDPSKAPALLAPPKTNLKETFVRSSGRTAKATSLSRAPLNVCLLTTVCVGTATVVFATAGALITAFTPMIKNPDSSDITRGTLVGAAAGAALGGAAAWVLRKCLSSKAALPATSSDGADIPVDQYTPL
jgi:hypothetical protein